jgi:hypothetical protein
MVKSVEKVCVSFFPLKLPLEDGGRTDGRRSLLFWWGTKTLCLEQIHNTVNIQHVERD